MALALTAIAACGETSVTAVATPEPATPSVPAPTLLTAPIPLVRPIDPPETRPVEKSPTTPPTQTTAATRTSSPRVEAPTPTPGQLTQTTIATPTPSTSAEPTPYPTPPPSPGPVILLPPRAPGVAVVQADPKSSLGVVPANWTSVFFVQWGSDFERARLADIIGLDIGPVFDDVERALGPEWAQLSAVTSVAFSDHRLGWSDTGIFTGDFGALEDILREASSTASATADTYRGLDFFTVTIPRYRVGESDDLHFAVLDSSMLVVAEGYEGSGLALIKEVLDRRIDEAELNESLAGLLAHSAPFDFLFAVDVGASAEEPPVETEYPRPKFVGKTGLANEGATTTLKYYYEFDEPAHAQQIEPLLIGQTQRGYNSGNEYAATDVRRVGNVLTAQVVVDDSEVGGFVFGN